MDTGNGSLKGACRHTVPSAVSHKYLPKSQSWGIWCVTGVCCVCSMDLNRNLAVNGGRGEEIWSDINSWTCFCIRGCQFWFLHSVHWGSSQPDQLVLALQWLLLERQAQKLEIDEELGVKNVYLFSVSRTLEGLHSLWEGKGKEQALGIQRSNSCCWLLVNNKGKQQSALK